MINHLQGEQDAMGKIGYAGAQTLCCENLYIISIKSQ